MEREGHLRNWPYLKHKHLTPEQRHCVEVAIADVGFGAWCGGAVPQGRPWGPGMAFVFPLGGRVDPADGERGEGSGGLQGLGGGSWREGCILEGGQLFQGSQPLTTLCLAAGTQGHLFPLDSAAPPQS